MPHSSATFWPGWNTTRAMSGYCGRRGKWGAHECACMRACVNCVRACVVVTSLVANQLQLMTAHSAAKDRRHEGTCSIHQKAMLEEIAEQRCHFCQAAPSQCLSTSSAFAQPYQPAARAHHAHHTQHTPNSPPTMRVYRHTCMCAHVSAACLLQIVACAVVRAR